jgi:hypothetical protein
MKLMKFYWLSCLILVVAVSCNKTIQSDLNSPENAGAAPSSGKKVLFVMLDGLVGSELRQVAPVNINSFAGNSVYSFDAVNSYRNDSVGNAYGWSSLLTGVEAAKHKVTGGFQNNNLSVYPSLVSRIKSANPAIKVTAIATNAVLMDNLLSDAGDKFLFPSNDWSAFNKAKEILTGEGPDLTVVHFSGIDSAGQASSYTSTTELYRRAIVRADQYIGELVNIIKARPNYSNEDWLIVLSSNKGGNQRLIPPAGLAWNAFDDKMHNIFLMYYNPRFIPLQYIKPTGIIPYAGATPIYTLGGAVNTAAPTRAIAPDLNTVKFQQAGDYTIQFKINNPSNQAAVYPGILGTAMYRWGNPNSTVKDNIGGGFVVYFEGAFYAVNLFRADGTRQVYIPGNNITDGAWHTINLVFKTDGGTRYIYLYTDGKYVNRGAIGDGLLSSTNTSAKARFKVGFMEDVANATSSTGTRTGVKITDIRIYNTALPEAYLLQNYCKPYLNDGDTYNSQLMAYWPSDNVAVSESGPSYLRDLSGNGRDLILENTPVTNFSETSPNLCPTYTDFTYRSLMTSVDVSYQIYTWLGLMPETQWGLDGKVLLPKYIDVSN